MTTLTKQHEQIVDAIAAADPARADAAVRGHLREILSDLSDVQKANPDVFEKDPDEAG